MYPRALFLAGDRGARVGLELLPAREGARRRCRTDLPTEEERGCR